MSSVDYSLLDRGIYSIPRAARLLGLSSQQIRAWMTPRRRVTDGIETVTPPIWEPILPVINGHVAVSFLELMELKIVRAMVQRRTINRKKIRACVLGWRGMTGDLPYPLVNQKFSPMLTPSTLAVELKDEGVCVDATTQQYIMSEIVVPERIDLEYDGGDLPNRWMPKIWKGGIVVSPLFSFGEPVVSDGYVPTSALALAAEIEGVEAAARQYGVAIETVRIAVSYERSLDQSKDAA